jgi:hypothetical protein
MQRRTRALTTLQKPPIEVVLARRYNNTTYRSSSSSNFGWVATTGFFDRGFRTLSYMWYFATMNQLRQGVFRTSGYELKTVYHFDLEISDEDKHRIQEIHDRKLQDVKVFFGKSFPRKAEECPPGMVVENMHIVIDAAHLIEYAMREQEELLDPNLLDERRTYLQGSSYGGYDVDFLKKLNYLYVGHNNFKNWIPVHIKILKIEGEKMMKKKFFKDEWIDANKVDETVNRM